MQHQVDESVEEFNDRLCRTCKPVAGAHARVDMCLRPDVLFIVRTPLQEVFCRKVSPFLSITIVKSLATCSLYSRTVTTWVLSIAIRAALVLQKERVQLIIARGRKEGIESSKAFSTAIVRHIVRVSHLHDPHVACDLQN